MKIIDGRILPDAGEVTIGQTIKIGYYTQEIEQDENAGIAYMDPELRVIDYIKNTAEYVRTEDGLVSASAMLDQFLFPPEDVYKRQVVGGAVDIYPVKREGVKIPFEPDKYNKLLGTDIPAGDMIGYFKKIDLGYDEATKEIDVYKRQIWNCSMVRQLHLRIWHFPFCHIF